MCSLVELITSRDAMRHRCNCSLQLLSSGMPIYWRNLQTNYNFPPCGISQHTICFCENANGINNEMWEIGGHLIYLGHYADVILGTMASQITSLTTVYSTVYSGADQRKHRSSASLAFVRGIHRRQMASNAENVSIWWRQYVQLAYVNVLKTMPSEIPLLIWMNFPAWKSDHMLSEWTCFYTCC